MKIALMSKEMQVLYTVDRGTCENSSKNNKVGRRLLHKLIMTPQSD